MISIKHALLNWTKVHHIYLQEYICLSYNPGFSVSQILFQPKEERSPPHLHGLRQPVWQLHQLFGSAKVNGLALGLGVARKYGRHGENPFKSNPASREGGREEGREERTHAGGPCLQTASSRELLQVHSHLARGPTPSQVGQYRFKRMEYKGLLFLAQLGIALKGHFSPKAPRGPGQGCHSLTSYLCPILPLLLCPLPPTGANPKGTPY